MGAPHLPELVYPRSNRNLRASIGPSVRAASCWPSGRRYIVSDVSQVGQ
ncbi:UNVERIFIED_ORG: hypothetical protein M2328_006763 [Rhodococcus erythropolis]